MKLRKVMVKDLDLSLGRLRQLPESAISGMMDSLKSKGQLTPLVASENDHVLVLVDGFLRHMAAVRLGISALFVEVVRLSLVQTKAQIYLRNRGRGLHLLEESRLVCELHDVDGLSQVEIGDVLERHKSWVCRRLSLYKSLSPHLLEEGALNRLTEGSLRRLGRLPTRNQEEIIAVVLRESFCSKDTALLLGLWLQARDPAAKRYLLEHARDAIERVKRNTEKPQDPRLGESGQQLLDSLSILRQTSFRLQRRARDGFGELPSEGLRLLVDARDKAHSECVSALCEVERILSEIEEEA